MLPYGKVGIEIETEGWQGDGIATLPKIWAYHVDNSLRNNGMEFTTKGTGIIGKDIAVTVREFCKWAKARHLSEGYPRAGIHIHLDCTDMDWEANQLHNMVACYMLVEHALYGFAGEWRRTCGFCDPLTESQLPMNQLREALFAKGSSGKTLTSKLNKLGRYYGLNLKALTKYGTVEYRQLETTFDENRIINWIQIIFQLKAFAMQWPTGRRILAEVSRDGARAFARRMMGSQWKHIEPFFNEDMLWAAVDAAIVMMEGADEPEPALDDWAEASVPSSPLLDKKQPKQRTKKEELVKEMIQDEAAIAPFAMPRPRRAVAAAPQPGRTAGMRLLFDGDPFVRVHPGQAPRPAQAQAAAVAQAEERMQAQHRALLEQLRVGGDFNPFDDDL